MKVATVLFVVLVLCLVNLASAKNHEEVQTTEHKHEGHVPRVHIVHNTAKHFTQHHQGATVAASGTVTVGSSKSSYGKY